MNDMRIFFLYLKEWKRGILLFSMLLVFLSLLLGCGGEGSPTADRLSGPAADEALPIRIDATVTPTFTPTPESENSFEDIPLADAEQTPTIAVPDEDLLTPISTPISSEESSDEESSDPEISEDEILPDPSPVPTPTPTTTEEDASSPPQEKSKKTLKNPEKQIKPTTLSQKGESSEKSRGQEEEDITESEEPEGQEDEAQTDEPEEENDVSSVTSTSITLDQLEVCATVSNREPVNIDTQFSLSKVGKVYTWMQVSGVKPPKVVKHIYYREGKVIAKVSLKLKYASMRTWSQKTFKPGESVGKWKVVVTTQNEKEVLAVKEFTVVQ